MMVQRRATWECRACPEGEQVLRPGLPHYVDRDEAEAGLRRHFVEEHAGLLWDESTRHLVSGDVLDYLPA